MKTTKTKKSYTRPTVQRVKIDKSISMVMQSLPPGDPGMKWGNPLK